MKGSFNIGITMYLISVWEEVIYVPSQQYLYTLFNPNGMQLSAVSELIYARNTGILTQERKFVGEFSCKVYNFLISSLFFFVANETKLCWPFLNCYFFFQLESPFTNSYYISFPRKLCAYIGQRKQCTVTVFLFPRPRVCSAILSRHIPQCECSHTCCQLMKFLCNDKQVHIDTL